MKFSFCGPKFGLANRCYSMQIFGLDNRVDIVFYFLGKWYIIVNLVQRMHSFSYQLSCTIIPFELFQIL